MAQCPPERLTSPSAAALRFGQSVAVNDRHLLIADPHDATLCVGPPDCANGWAFAYQRDADGNWVKTQDVLPAGLTPGYAYGWAMALDGDRVIINASLAPGGAGVGLPFIFEFDGERWVEAGSLPPPDDRAIHGERLALHGDTALVGKAGEDVLIYQKANDGWEVIGDLSSPDSPSVRADFGWGIDLNDEWIVIGSPAERLTREIQGAAYVYRRLPGGGVELAQKLVVARPYEWPRFGEAVAISGDQIFIGAITADGTAEDQGKVHVFDLVEGSWELRGELVASDAAARDSFGSALAVDGNLMVVGAQRKVTPLSGGAAYLFQRDASGQWREIGKLFPEEVSASYGTRVAIGGGVAVIGAPVSPVGGTQRGAVDLFDLACFACPPDLDADGRLTVFDFLTFLNLFQDGDPIADFDGDGELTVFDFLAFQTAFDAGC